MRRVRAWLAWLHLWLGLVAGTLFALIGLSGSVLTFHTELLRWQHPQLARFAAPGDAQAGAVVDALRREWTARGIGAIDFPRDDLPVFQAYFTDGSRRYFSPEDGSLLLTRTPGDDWLLWLHELHTDLLAGAIGHEAVGVVGLIALFLIASGLYLWWPRLSQLAAQLRWYRGPPARRWMSWHRSSGALTLPLLLLVTATGAAMVYHHATRDLFTVLLGGGETPQPVEHAVDHPVDVDWPRVVAAARAAFPEATLVRSNTPRPDSALVGFRVRADGEWHPNGRSEVWIDATDHTPVLVHDARTQAAGARASETMYPLHIGAVGGWPYRAAVAASGLLPAFLLFTGFLYWRRRRGR